MKIYINPNRSNWPEILKRPIFDVSDLNQKVGSILAKIKDKGDNALKKYTLKFDGVELENPEVAKEEIDAAENQIDNKLKEAILLASKNIEKFHASQKTEIKKV